MTRPGEGDFHVRLVGLSRANHAVVRPDGNTFWVGLLPPLAFLHHFRISLLDQLANTRKRYLPPIVTFPCYSAAIWHAPKGTVRVARPSSRQSHDHLGQSLEANCPSCADQLCLVPAVGGTHTGHTGSHADITPRGGPGPHP